MRTLALDPIVQYLTPRGGAIHSRPLDEISEYIVKLGICVEHMLMGLVDNVWRVDFPSRPAIKHSGYE